MKSSRLLIISLLSLLHLQASGFSPYLRKSHRQKMVLKSSSAEPLEGPSYVSYADLLCGKEGDKDAMDDICELPSEDEFLVGILGDLHIDPRKMDDYEEGREHFIPILEDAQQRGVNVGMVSLGDLGESKSVRPEETDELFAGTTECHMMAAEYLRSFGVPYEVVGGNHDLEGIDEFDTDEANLQSKLERHTSTSMRTTVMNLSLCVLVSLCSVSSCS